jgi:hypothetical protein
MQSFILIIIESINRAEVMRPLGSMNMLWKGIEKYVFMS